MAGSLGIRRLDGIGERSVNAALECLLTLTSDAVVVFDGAGRVLLANEQASKLFGPVAFGNASLELVGCDVRALFPPAVGSAPETPFSLGSLPFSTDGCAHELRYPTTPLARSVTLTLRCDRVAMTAGETYLIVARPSTAEQAAVREHDRLVDELSRANHRLAGTLGIVLGTLDAQDVPTLFSRVIDEVTDTMDATGTVVYVATGDGFRFQGASASLKDLKLPHYLSADRGLDSWVVSSEKALRLRVLEPSRDDLRAGHLEYRDVVDEQTREVHRVSRRVLPPFISLIVVPVWFGGHVIAIFEVGWTQVHPTTKEDGELLDAVTRYLSVQLAGAYSAMRQRRRQRLTAASTEIRETLMSSTEDDASDVRDRLCEEVAHALSATVVPLKKLATGDVMGNFGEAGSCKVGFDVEELVSQGEPLGDVTGASLSPIAATGEAGSWLSRAGFPCTGVLADFGGDLGFEARLLILRDYDAEPFDDLEHDFLGRLAGDIAGLARGRKARGRDRHIAQALQTGMKNELQHIDGITADGIYSSATATASVGGDFYDLIRLPNHKACAIMGDVSGKGVEAASVSAAVRTALGAYAWQGIRPSRMVRLLNEFLLGFSRLETFATLFVGICDLRQGTLTYCSAGHPPALLVRAKTGSIETLGVQSGVVGAFHDMTYRDGHVKLQEGDELLLYTDGTTEARSPDGSFFGEDGLNDMVMREVPRGFDGLLERFLATLDTFTGRHLEDDVAMVALRFDHLGDGPEALEKGE